jgi:hypothetical protein
MLLSSVMTDDKFLDDEEGAPTPEDEAHDRKIKEAQEWFAELERDGWQRRGPRPCTELFDPHEPEVGVWLNPYTGVILLSPRHIERIKALLAAECERAQ